MLNKNAVAYAATSFAATSMNTVFFFYYVKLFLVEYKVSQTWFQIAQVSYMVWNAINDPLFGYFQDNSDWAIFRQRKMSIYYGAPLWALTFMLPWFQWANYAAPGNTWIAGVQLCVCLCAYDTMLTFVLLAHCSIFTEISTELEDRLQLTKYHQVASVLGSTSVFLSSLASDNMKDLGNLQLYCLFIAIVSCICMRYTGRNVKTRYESTDMSDAKSTNVSNEKFGAQGAFKITKQILFNRNFLSFVVMNLLQVFHNTFCANFLIIFVDRLIPKESLPQIYMSIIYGASYILPQCLILLGGNVISAFGTYKVVMTSFFIQVIASTFMYFHGRHDPALLAAFFILDATIPAAVFNLFNILVSDIIDDDQRKYSRKQPQSSMVFGTNALFTKPGNSLAPMLVVAVLNSYGYETLKNSYSDKEIIVKEVEDLHDVMFNLLCFIPLLLSLCQIAVWKFYKLRSNTDIIPKHVES